MVQRVKNLLTVQETLLSLGWEHSLEREMGDPLQYSCLENPMNTGAWQATVHRITKSCTQLSDSAAAAAGDGGFLRIIKI